MSKAVLAIDDSPSIRQMVSFTLKNAGYDVVEASDGMDGLAKAKTQGFNLVLTDQNMPRMDGISLTKKLRENPKFKATSASSTRSSSRNPRSTSTTWRRCCSTSISTPRTMSS